MQIYSPPGRGVDIAPRWLKFEFKPLNQAAATSRATGDGFKFEFMPFSRLGFKFEFKP